MKLRYGVANDSGAVVVMKIVDTRGTIYVRIGPAATITDYCWTEVRGNFALLDAEGTPTELVLYFSGPQPGTGLSLTTSAWCPQKLIINRMKLNFKIPYCTKDACIVNM